MYKKVSDEKKKRTVIKVGNGNAFDFVRYTSFYVSFKRHNQRQVENNTWFIEIFCLWKRLWADKIKSQIHKNRIKRL